jgi:hypothetical protein
MYDTKRDPLEMTNLAHAAHVTPESETERARLHQRLIDVMKTIGTTPDEIDWPSSTTTSRRRRPPHDRRRRRKVLA